MGIVSHFLLRHGRRRFRQISERVRNPMPVQRRLLERVLSKGSRSEQGRKLELAAVTDVADYQRRVPLCRHEDVFELWERAFHGEPDVFWPGYIRYWGMSSGTTSAAGSNKYIPLSAETIRTNVKGGFDSVASYLHHSNDATLMNGRARLLFLGGSTELTEIPSKHRPGKPNWHGDNTGITAKFIPWWAARYYTPGRELAWLGDWEEKVERIADRTRHEDVRLISGVPSWMAILFDRIREKEGGRPIGEVWPNLRAYVHGGMSFGPYRDLFREQIGRDIACVDTYSATEGGIMAVQDRLGGDDHAQVPLVDLGVFFEFVPVDQADQPHPEAHTLDQVQAGVNYAIVMTTNAGLYRYVVGDTLKFVETDPPRLVFTGRLSAFLNFFGEHVIVSELDSAITAAGAATGTTVRDYTVTPVFPGPGKPTPGHRWYVEFADGRPDDLAAFGKALDDDIRTASNNLDYDSHRKDNLGLAPPDVIPVPPGTFYDWMKSRGKLGGQNKLPRVLTDPDLITSLTNLLATNGGSG